MRIAHLKRFFSRFLQVRQTTKLATAASGAAPLLDFDPFWHGDHWQNLLASPMDARHYVMEDWVVSSPDEFETPRAGWPKDRHNNRRGS